MTTKEMSKMWDTKVKTKVTATKGTKKATKDEKETQTSSTKTTTVVSLYNTLAYMYIYYSGPYFQSNKIGQDTSYALNGNILKLFGLIFNFPIEPENINAF